MENENIVITENTEVLPNPHTEVDNNPILERDGRGLVKGVQYKFKKTGYRNVIDWRGMILPEHLSFNRQHQKEIEERYGKPLDQLSVTEVEDKYLLILLPGIKELAALRGFTEVDPQLTKNERDHCAAICKITWIPNFETCNEFVTFGDGAGASLDNTNGFGQIFLETIALNRAFVRAVRNFLGINIVGQDEIGGKLKNTKSDNGNVINPFSSNALLQQRCADKNINFEAFRTRVLEAYKDKLSNNAKPDTWQNFGDLSAVDASTLLEIIK